MSALADDLWSGAVEAAAREFENDTRRWMYDPAAFAQECIAWPADAELADYQRRVMDRLPTRRRVAVRGPHGLGKSALAALIVHWFVITREAAGIDWKVITTASGWRHLSAYLWPEIHLWARRVRWDLVNRAAFNERTELLTLQLKLRYGAATAVASKEPARIEGAHAKHLLYLIDEAKTVPPDTWDAIEGAFSGGTGAEAYAVAFSTPGPPAGRFYEIHRRAAGYEDWDTIHVTLAEAVAAGRISQEWADQRALQWGTDSAIYHNRVLGEFHAGDETTTIPLAWAEAAVERWHEWRQAGGGHERPLRLGVDVARSGPDRTVLAHRYGHVYDRLEDHVREDTMKTTSRVIAATSGQDGALAIVDSLGVGGGVVDRLRELEQPVLAYTGSAKTDRLDRARQHGFTNVRSAAYWYMRELLDPTYDPVLALPDDDRLLSELCAPLWSEVSGIPPKIQVEPKDQLAERLGHSPDFADAVVMSAWADTISRTGSTSAGLLTRQDAQLVEIVGSGYAV